MAGKFEVPRFLSESEEAQWWFDHQDDLASAFAGAAEDGFGRSEAFRKCIFREGLICNDSARAR